MVTGLIPLKVTPVIDAISYMVDFHALLMWLDHFILLGLRLGLRALPQGTRPHFHLKMFNNAIFNFGIFFQKTLFNLKVFFD